MVRRRAVLASIILSLLAAVALQTGTALAASQPRSVSPNNSLTPGVRPLGGVTISPAFQDITIGQNEASKDEQVKVTNNTGEPVEFSVAVTDFGSLDETGGVLFIGKDQKTLNYRYGLSSWITLQKDRVVVDPKSTEAVPFTITNKESMAPGGHYGALLITPVEDDEHPTKVDIQQVLTSLLFVKKQGGEIYRLGLEDVKVQHSLFSAPGSVSLRFQNGGNIHVVPRGVLTVTDPAGYQVKQGIINDGSAIILPQSFRQLSVPLNTLSEAWLPGRYHLRIAYRYDGQSAVTYYDTSFYYLNGWYVVLGVFLLALILGLVLSRSLRRALGWPLRAVRKRAKRT